MSEAECIHLLMSPQGGVRLEVLRVMYKRRNKNFPYTRKINRQTFKALRRMGLVSGDVSWAFLTEKGLSVCKTVLSGKAGNG